MNEMNEIAKKAASERLLKAMQLEKMGPSDAARHLNILAQYISMSKQEKYWPKMPKSAWDRILLWCNSGLTLQQFRYPEGEVKVKENWPVTQLPPKIINPIDKITAPLAVEKAEPKPGQDFTDTARLKVCLDIEINLVINGQKVNLK